MSDVPSTPALVPVDDGTAALARRLVPIRDAFVQAFAAAVADAAHLGPVHLEPAMRDGQGNVAREGVLSTGLRPDFVQDVDGGSQPIYVDAPWAPGQVPFTFELNRSVYFEVHPFRWQDFRMRLMPGEDLDLNHLTTWFWSWFDEHDLNEASSDGFYGVVHWLSEPQETHTGVVLDLDLGTAPVEAFLALTDALALTGASHVIVWSQQPDVAEPEQFQLG